LAALTIKWESMPRIAPTETSDVELTGETVGTSKEEAPATAPQAADRPFLVLVADAGGGDEVEKIDNVVLKDERIAIGSRAFRAVRMSPEDASSDPILSKAGKTAPRFVIVSADYKSTTVIEDNRLSISSLWDAMKAQASKFYANSLDATVKDMRELMREYDKIDGERTILTAKQEKLKEKKGSEADVKEVETKLAQIEERQSKAEAKEKTLWELKPKSA
jgi:hypothetical protein